MDADLAILDLHMTTHEQSHGCDGSYMQHKPPQLGACTSSNHFVPYRAEQKMQLLWAGTWTTHVTARAFVDAEGRIVLLHVLIIIMMITRKIL